MNLREDDVVSAVALVVETEAGRPRSRSTRSGLASTESGTADEPALDGDGVYVGDPDEDGMLGVPEVESPTRCRDSDVEE